MIEYEILNILRKSGGQWQYTGQLIDGDKRIAVGGSVENYLTDSQIKKAIITEMERVKLDYIASQRPLETKQLSEDANFKKTLSVSV